MSKHRAHPTHQDNNVDAAQVVASIDKHIGEKLRSRREFMGVTMAQIAKALDITFQQIQKYECGENKIKAAMLYQMATYLQVPVGYFYDGLDGVVDVSQADYGDPLFVSFAKEDGGRELAGSFMKLSTEGRRSLLSLVKATMRLGTPAEAA